MNILQLIDPMIAATNPYNTMLGMSRAIDGLPQRVRRCPKSKGILRVRRDCPTLQYFSVFLAMQEYCVNRLHFFDVDSLSERVI